MRFIRISTLAVIAAAAVPAAAAAAERPPATGSDTAIIAILIGQVHAQPFTPPIGTNHGS
ncbi:hypothetical protein OJ997_05765 [Solirubrobacter phytolaccae]|uniref:Uncharacterized protein n=1 Tax=Solirubrobacter phytolaccae TaxID=1404360 RepID=A0A9X3SDM4_9ACTN|nr:hypothetical protein [Solirubrobacter phytolaccae]MDA0179792.1 hypothetical protein [Solirubrobacter phytolaccae]